MLYSSRDKMGYESKMLEHQQLDLIFFEVGEKHFFPDFVCKSYLYFNFF